MGYAIGIDLGGTKILTALVNKENGEILASIKKKTKKEQGSDKVIEKLLEAIDETIEKAPVPKEKIDSIGIGAAGQVDREKGILIAAPNLDCYNIELKKIVETKFNIPTFIGNDVEIATLGELKFGAGKGYDNFVCIFVGTGIGSGIILNRKHIKGATGTAGEIGHMVVAPGGRPCNCGAMGCLEAYASRSAIEKRIVGAMKKGRKSIISEYMNDEKPISSSMIKKSTEKEDELVIQALDEASEYLSAGIASVINFYNPQLIILGGGLIDAVDYFYQKVIKKAHVKSLPTPAEKIEFKKAALGDFSGVIGAAFLDEK